MRRDGGRNAGEHHGDHHHPRHEDYENCEGQIPITRRTRTGHGPHPSHPSHLERRHVHADTQDRVEPCEDEQDPYQSDKKDTVSLEELQLREVQADLAPVSPDTQAVAV